MDQFRNKDSGEISSCVPDISFTEFYFRMDTLRTTRNIQISQIVWPLVLFLSNIAIVSPSIYGSWLAPLVSSFTFLLQLGTTWP